VPGSEEVDPVTTHVARLLREAKDRSGLSYTELHDRTSLSRSAIQNYLDGSRSPLIRDLVRLCAALGVSAGDLLDAAEAAARK
jgi:transcriptional regulator with XRE-family HTH domain